MNSSLIADLTKSVIARWNSSLMCLNVLVITSLKLASNSGTKRHSSQSRCLIKKCNLLISYTMQNSYQRCSTCGATDSTKLKICTGTKTKRWSPSGIARYKTWIKIYKGLSQFGGKVQTLRSWEKERLSDWYRNAISISSTKLLINGNKRAKGFKGKFVFIF